jgi:D-3-phosphoglycerate dehydrogenase
MFKVLTYNNISAVGLDKFPRDLYEVASEIQNPDALMLRSFDLHGVAIPETLKVVGRAGAGVNNIPVAEYSKRGIPVFNAPGANANAVKELVIAGMLLAARNICGAWDYARRLEGDDHALHTLVEKGKKQYAGFELTGKTLAVLGLGAIGVKVANAAIDLGMNVIGFDPQLTVESAWQLASSATRAASIDDLIARADLLTLHVPLNDHTRHIINTARLDVMKKGAILLNFSRDKVVDEAAVIAALEAGQLGGYVCDFPSRALLAQPKVVALPHLGASTGEAEDNCAAMVADQIRDYLENGNIRNAVNLPEVVMPRTEGSRLAVVNENVPNMVGQISSTLAEANLNILDLVNKSRGDLAYTLLDVNADIPEATVQRLRAIAGVLSARVV